ncbi:C4-dicarboxylate ABC transporter [Pseudoduganella sp. FT25W]|uniref:C4-dicarboxylate ABC transporter n=1 Tax=Duganella alba TaxID=2666081 RepID=A0A6L5QC04_9BURK|nr:SLAC1 anion channel family protein [Duganella alba]MRX07038.1 C4-dicarboxylate ABC transporter [Duganella alba]MRX16065.1 C4-dicarboxylate ABC transporter [Duganella alba]
MQNESTTLSYLPVGIFGGVMGLSGLSVAWKLAHQHFGAPLWISQAIGLAAVAAFVALVIAYGIKAWSGWETVRAEFNHPIASNLFGTPMISLLLLPFVLVDYSLALARLSWLLGAIGMTALAWTIVMRWMTVRLAAPQVAPAWIVPVVGMLDVPLAVPLLQWDGLHGVMVFGLAVGLFFAVPLFTLIFQRLVLEEPLAPPMQPSLLVMVAPFAVGFTAYVTTTGGIDLFAQILYMLMVFVLAVLLGRLRHLPHCSPFRVSWWAASFPLAASAGAAIRYAGQASSPVTDGIALVVLAIASLTILIFLAQTLAGVFKGQLKALA